MVDRKRAWGVALLCVVAAGGAISFFVNRNAPPDVNRIPTPPRMNSQASGKGFTMRSGEASIVAEWDTAPSPRQPAGRFPLIRKDSNPHTRSMAEALESGKYPERLSPLITPAAFDLVEFQKDPKHYLDIVEPGRVWQVAQPGLGVIEIKSRTPYLIEIEQGQTVPLQVQVTPEAPVTFTSFDGGSFHNLLASITVQADESGLASAQMTGTTGVVGDVNILAASPIDSGQARFVVHVLQPKIATAAVESK